MGLHDSYAVVRSQILMIHPELKLSEVYSILFQEEGQRGLDPQPNPTNDALAMVSQSSKYTPRPSYDASLTSSGSILKCKHCDYSGHT